MNGKQIIMAFTGILCAASLSGCASNAGIVSSLEDLSTESVREGVVEVPQYRVASIPGWLPFADVGSLHFYKPSRKPASIIGLSPGKSFKLISEIRSDCKEDCLYAIRDDIAALGTLAQTLVRSRVDLSELLARQSDAGGTGDSKAVEQAKEAYAKAQLDFDGAYEKVSKSISHNGLLIYRWTTDSSQSGSIGLDKLFDTTAKENSRHSGFALVSGVRTTTLFIGEDLKDAWGQLNKCSRFADRFGLTTYTMQAKHIVYGNLLDLSQYATAKIEASYDQLAHPAETLKALTTIEIGMALSRVSNLSNLGVMGNVVRRTAPVDWDDESLRNRLSEPNQLCEPNRPCEPGWLTFYSVESDFKDLLELLGRPQQCLY